MRKSRASCSWVSSGSGISWVRSIVSAAAVRLGPRARAFFTGSTATGSDLAATGRVATVLIRERSAGLPRIGRASPRPVNEGPVNAGPVDEKGGGPVQYWRSADEFTGSGHGVV